MRCQLQQTSRTSLGCRSACQPQLSRKFAPTQPLSNTSRIVTQAGLFGLQFGGASATDVKSKKEGDTDSLFFRDQSNLAVEKQTEAVFAM